MIRKYILSGIALLWALVLFPQQSLKVMSYNLLNYGNNWGDCTDSNNDYHSKTSYIHTIVNYVQPDIFAVVEMGTNSYYSQYLLDNALNTNGVTKWKKGNPPNNSGAYTVNQIYYDSQRLQLLGSYGIETNYRDINIYRFKIIDDVNGNEYPLNCIVGHLKAGQDYAAERKTEILKLLNHSVFHSLDGNILFMGDFNFYSSNEAGYVQLLNYSDVNLRFYDPVNKPGSWHNNSYFKNFDTQSTHMEGDCAAGGGMDDRFDFILTSAKILSGAQHIRYLPGSYTTIGQDGNHFNQAINQGGNTSVPSNVLNALYHNSDHLPVSLRLEYGENIGIEDSFAESPVRLQNPCKDYLRLFLPVPLSSGLPFSLIDMMGKTHLQGEIKASGENISIPLNGLHQGIYILQLRLPDSNILRFKVLKN